MIDIPRHFTWSEGKCLPNLEVFMSLTVILAVGLDSSLLANQGSVWQPAGYILTSTGSVREAIHHFKNGDFDLILLGHSIPAESRERLTFLIRSSGSRIPVVCITDGSGYNNSFADATIRNEPGDVIEGIGELLAKRAMIPAATTAVRSNSR